MSIGGRVARYVTGFVGVSLRDIMSYNLSMGSYKYHNLFHQGEIVMNFLHLHSGVELSIASEN